MHPYSCKTQLCTFLFFLKYKMVSTTLYRKMKLYSEAKKKIEVTFLK
uniref:Uncharacterized protein n=1 Tax=Anguilla anguilla TaxID=7936 RepID=A0A0E9WKL7_ANGAN